MLYKWNNFIIYEKNDRGFYNIIKNLLDLVVSYFF